MILPIVMYGDPILKREADEIDENHPGLSELIDNMFDTMYNANGVGLAAPQIGESIRLFVVDTKPFSERYDDEDDDEDDAMTDAERSDLAGFKQVFINPIMLEESGEKWPFNEGCLSIPGIHEDVMRKSDILIEYYDQHFQLREERFTGRKARVIQHEYDHIEGILFTDHLNPLRKQFLKKRLSDIANGRARADYKVRYYKK